MFYNFTVKRAASPPASSTTASKRKEKKTSVKFDIPFILDQGFGERMYPIKIGTIHNPSKAWLVLAIDALTFYANISEMARPTKIRFPKDKMKVGHFCVVYCSQLYYRARINKIVHLEDMIIAFMLDIGIFTPIETQNVYYMTSDVSKIPRIATRTILSKIRPPGMFTKLSTN